VWEEATWFWEKFDFIVVNDTIDTTAKTIETFIKEEQK
jgi:guanylate kinase